MFYKHRNLKTVSYAWRGNLMAIGLRRLQECEMEKERSRNQCDNKLKHDLTAVRKARKTSENKYCTTFKSGTSEQY